MKSLPTYSSYGYTVDIEDNNTVHRYTVIGIPAGDCVKIAIERAANAGILTIDNIVVTPITHVTVVNSTFNDEP